MTSRHFHLTRLADLQSFFKSHFPGRYTNRLRRKFGWGAVDLLLPRRRKRIKYISLEMLDKLEAFAGELGYRSLPSDSSATEHPQVQCPSCGDTISVLLCKSHRPDVSRFF
jgi:hypothetical protein